MTRGASGTPRVLAVRHPLYVSWFATVVFASTANAATLYVSPNGTATTDCTRSAPCDLESAASSAMAGDTVILMDGVYSTPLNVTNSGTTDAWITFQADECATPIIEGEGVGPNDDNQDTGIGSDQAEYVRFQGIVARGWNTGFGNGWAGGTDSDEESNGHWEIENCISYSNGRTGFTFYSAADFTLRHTIAAHNGSSIAHSWSSGVTLYEAHGTNLVDGNVSFENTDAERNTDGSGFIVDEESNDATFINNVAFGNAGSCLRLTKSSGTRFINNTCYHNSQFGSRATGPGNPGELYFTNGGVTQQNVSFMNNVLVGTGQAPAGSDPVINQPPSGFTNNVVTTGSVSYFSDPTGDNPSFVPASGEMTLTGQGSSGNGVPTADIGFDPKCIVKRTPVMVGQVASESWWQYDIDIDYIKSIGGVAMCFNAATRAGSPAIGAYKAGAVTTVAPGTCVPPPEPEPDPNGGAGGTGGAGVAGTDGAGMGGASPGGAGMDAAGTGGVSMAGMPATSGAPNGGAPMGGGVGGTATAAAGTSNLPAAGNTASEPVDGAAGDASSGQSGGTSTGPASSASPSSGGAQATSADASESEPTGCGCRLARESDPRRWLAALSFLGLSLVAFRRRRLARSRG